jgi:hypothetical protein
MRLKPLLILLLTPLCLAQGAHRISQVLVKGNNIGANVAPYANILVCVANTGCATAASVFSDEALTVPLTLPLVADGSGNYDYYVPTGCYDEQISTPGSEDIFLPNVCPFNGIPGGGVTQIIAGANVTISPTNGLGAVTITSTGGGGSGNPGAPFFSQQYNNSGAFGGSAASLDAAGDSVIKSLNGSPLPQLFQTSPGSNDGITNALQTAGATVIVNAGYASVEDPITYGTGAWRTPFGFGGFGSRPSFAANTNFVDYRGNSLGTVNFNTAPNIISNYNLFLQDDVPQASGTGDNWTMTQYDWLRHCCGKDEQAAVGNWTTVEQVVYNMFDQGQGITSLMVLNLNKDAIGDAQGINNNMFCSGGAITPSDEGCSNYRNQSLQPGSLPILRNNATLPKGTTTILSSASTLITNGSPGEGHRFVDSTQESSVYHVTTTTNASGINAGTLTTYEAISGPFETVGRSPNAILTPQQYKGATTNETISLTNLTAAITSGGAYPTACIADSTYTEQATVVSVGAASGTSPNITQTVTLALRLEHYPNAYVTQGPHACWGVESVVNQQSNGAHCTGNPANPPCPLRTLSYVIGVQDAHTILYSRSETSSGWVQFGNGLFTSVNFPATGLTRTGGIASIPAPAGLNININHDTIQLTGCTDSSFNGTFANVVSGATTLSWTNAGSNGSTTCANPVWIINPVNGFPANGAAMLPMSTVVQANNPTTHLPDLSYVIDANDYTIAANDQMEIQPLQILANIYHDLYQVLTPTTGSNGNAIFQQEIIGPIPDEFTYMSVLMSANGANDLAGSGGTRRPGGTIFSFENDLGNFGNWMTAGAPSGAMFTAYNCGSVDCSDPNYQGYFLFNLVGPAGGGYNSSFTPPTGIYKSIASLGGKSSIFSQGPGTASIQAGGTGYNSSISFGDPTVGSASEYQLFFQNTTGTQNQDTDVISGASMVRNILNISNGNQCTFTQTATGFTFANTGGGTCPTALDINSTIGGSIPILPGSAGVTGQAACYTAAGKVGHCTSAVSGSGACTCS